MLTITLSSDSLSTNVLRAAQSSNSSSPTIGSLAAGTGCEAAREAGPGTAGVVIPAAEETGSAALQTRACTPQVMGTKEVGTAAAWDTGCSLAALEDVQPFAASMVPVLS